MRIDTKLQLWARASFDCLPRQSKPLCLWSRNPRCAGHVAEPPCSGGAKRHASGARFVWSPQSFIISGAQFTTSRALVGFDVKVGLMHGEPGTSSRLGSSDGQNLDVILFFNCFVSL